MERRYAFKYGTVTPIVYVTIGESGVQLTLRFMVHTRRRRGAVDLVSRRILSGFADEPGIRFAYTAYRIYRPDEKLPDGTGSSVGEPRDRGSGSVEGIATDQHDP